MLSPSALQDFRLKHDSHDNACRASHVSRAFFVLQDFRLKHDNHTNACRASLVFRAFFPLSIPVMSIVATTWICFSKLHNTRLQICAFHV